LRSLTDDEYGRFINYMESSLNLMLDVMLKEKSANAQVKPGAAPEEKPAPKRAAKATRKTPARKSAPRKHKRAPAAKRKKV
jgi:hypothetical protein